VATHGDRDPERQRQRGERAEQARAAGDRRRERAEREQGNGGTEAGFKRVAMHAAQSRRVPDIGQQEGRGQHERTQHRPRPTRVLTGHHHRGGEQRDHDHADLGERTGKRCEGDHAARI
jgi:hypothetical protein